MGYCYMSGRYVISKDGNNHWKFLKCDGRSSKCAVDNFSNGTPYHGMKRNSDCIEYCKTYQQAVDAIEDWYFNHRDEKMKVYDER